MNHSNSDLVALIAESPAPFLVAIPTIAGVGPARGKFYRRRRIQDDDRRNRSDAAVPPDRSVCGTQALTGRCGGSYPSIGQV
jgi:hypothetical protein